MRMTIDARMTTHLAAAAAAPQGYICAALNGTTARLHRAGFIAHRGWHGGRNQGGFAAFRPGYYLTPAGWRAAGVPVRPDDVGRLTETLALALAARLADPGSLLLGSAAFWDVDSD